MMKWLDGQRDELARSLLTADTSGCSIIIRSCVVSWPTCPLCLELLDYILLASRARRGHFPERAQQGGRASLTPL